jgi:hypothetical protein
MSNLEKVLVDKGIKADVAFIAVDGNNEMKMIYHNGNLLVYSNLFRDYFKADSDTILGIVLGDITIRAIGFPEYGDMYYVPDLFNKYKTYYWRGSAEDRFYKSNGLVCKTKEGAIKMAEYFIKSAKDINFDEEEK